MTPKELFTKFLKSMGADDEKATEMTTKMFPESGEADLDTDELLTMAQQYAEPHLLPSWKDKEHKAITGKAMGDIITRIVKNSNGKLKRADLEDKTLEEMLSAYADITKTPAQNEDYEKMIKDLQDEKISIEQKLTKQIEDIQAEYTGKERAQKIQGAIKGFLAKKTLTVSPEVALKAIMPSSNERFDLNFNDKEVLALYQKGTDTLARNQKGTAFASLDEELDTELATFNFVAKSKGSGEGDGKPKQFAPQKQEPGGRVKLSERYAEAGLSDGTE